MKKIIYVLIMFLVIAPLGAADYQDISISLGSISTYGYYGEYGIEDSLRASLSFNIGLTSHLEMAAGMITELTPSIFNENTAFLEFSYALLGERSTASKVAGVGINTLISIGGFYTGVFNSDYQGAGAYLSITPLTVGSPVTGHRERILKTNIGYDFINNRVIVSFSLLTFDFYVRGTYRDYY